MERAAKDVTAMDLVQVIYKVLHMYYLLLLLLFLLLLLLILLPFFSFFFSPPPLPPSSPLSLPFPSQDVDPSLWKGAEGNVLHHLNKLFKEGHVGKNYCLRVEKQAVKSLCWESA